MIKKYQNLANLCLLIAAIIFGLAIHMGRNSSTGNVWGPGGAPDFLLYLLIASIVLVFFFHALSKGRSGFLGIFYLLGLGWLANLIEPKTDTDEMVKEEKKTFTKDRPK